MNEIKQARRLINRYIEELPEPLPYWPWFVSIAISYIHKHLCSGQLHGSACGGDDDPIEK